MLIVLNPPEARRPQMLPGFANTFSPGRLGLSSCAPSFCFDYSLETGENEMARNLGVY